jgi:hypothetical protein
LFFPLPRGKKPAKQEIGVSFLISLTMYRGYEKKIKYITAFQMLSWGEKWKEMNTFPERQKID